MAAKQQMVTTLKIIVSLITTGVTKLAGKMVDCSVRVTKQYEVKT